MSANFDILKKVFARTRAEMAKVIIGQEAVIDLCLIVIFTGYHALIEGVPGIAKTLLVRTLAKVLGCEFSRIQFTPDLMPADITGTHVFNLKTNEFDLVKGPVFTSFLLADEINRAPAKTQSALLQAMQERCVTIDRQTYSLGDYFTVFATQNPIEYEGTYPLPEAQKDRFMLKIRMDFPQRNEELLLAQRMLGSDAPEAILERGVLKPIITANILTSLRKCLMEISVQEDLIAYIVDLVRKTRDYPTILVGAGPRATQSLVLCARALAAIRDRDFVIPDDIKTIAVPVLEHRLVLRPEYEIEGLTAQEVVEQLLQDIPVPR